MSASWGRGPDDRALAETPAATLALVLFIVAAILLMAGAW